MSDILLKDIIIINPQRQTFVKFCMGNGIFFRKVKKRNIIYNVVNENELRKLLKKLDDLIQNKSCIRWFVDTQTTTAIELLRKKLKELENAKNSN